MGDNKFAPDSSLTYAQFVTMLVNALYKDEESAYYKTNSGKIDEYYGGDLQWWGHYVYFFGGKTLLKDTNTDIKSISVMNSSVNRYEMAQIVRNILDDKGIAVSDQDKTAARSKITDWSGVPAKYQDAVSASFALNILSGMGDGSFGGTGILTRAQACVVMTKLDDAIRDGGSSGGGGTTDKGTGYVIGDNKFESGYLNNGKPITEENVLELLAKAKTIWPEGTKWNDSETDPANHFYKKTELRTEVDGILLNGYHESTTYACGGFAAMISDYLFGKYNNQMRCLDDVSKTRPGDIIVRLKANGRPEHIMVATSTPDANGYIYYTDGNYGSAVHWGNVVREKSILSQGKSLEVWTRYPG